MAILRKRMPFNRTYASTELTSDGHHHQLVVARAERLALPSDPFNVPPLSLISNPSENVSDKPNCSL